MENDLKQLTDEMFELKDTRARLQFELKQVEKRIEKQEIAFMQILKESDLKEIEYGNCTFGYKTTTRQALDQKLLKEKFPEQYNACYLKKQKEDFYFEIN